MIANAINAINLTDFDEYSVGRFIADIDYIDSMDCADITISDDSADGWIATAINSGNFTVCAKDATGSLIPDIYSGFYMDCSDITISDYSTDGLISTAIDSTYFTDTNVSYYVIGGLMILMC